MRRLAVTIACALTALGAPLASQTAMPCPAPAFSAPAPTVTAAPPNLDISWAPVSGACGYGVVRRNPDATCWNITAGGTTATSIKEVIPATAGTYQYQVGVRLVTGQYALSQWTSFAVVPPPQVLTPPEFDGTPEIMSDGPPPAGLAVSGTPTTATVTWSAPTGALNYRVNRAPAGTTAWTSLTQTAITTTSLVNDVLPDPRQTYTYSVLAFQKDGHFGEAHTDFKAPLPTNPTGLTGTASGTSVSLSWQPVQHAAGYLVSGPGISGTKRVSATTYAVAAAPAGTNVYRVGSVFDPGAVQTASSQWPSVTVEVYAPVTSCACTRTGPFSGVAFDRLNVKGLTGSFTYASAGTFTITAQSVNGNDMLDIHDAQGRSVLSVTNPAAWGKSPDGRYFLVAMPPFSLGAGSDVSVYAVKAGPQKWRTLVNTTAMADGLWGFSEDGSMFVVTRYQNAPTRFSFQAHNLLASNPNTALLPVGENEAYGPAVSISPCGDRLLYARWTQLSPTDGAGTFYRRTRFGSTDTPVQTEWDGAAQTTPTASVIAGSGPNVFLVQLHGLKVRGTGATTIPSLQCTP